MSGLVKLHLENRPTRRARFGSRASRIHIFLVNRELNGVAPCVKVCDQYRQQMRSDVLR